MTQEFSAYRWEGEKDCTLMYQTKTRLPFLGKRALAVPAEHKAAVDEFLKKHCQMDT
jgi:hypothetical protein